MRDNRRIGVPEVQLAIGARCKAGDERQIRHPQPMPQDTILRYPQLLNSLCLWIDTVSRL
jgi:hypothetical protein